MIKTLLVDDENSFLDLAKTYLEKLSHGIKVETTNSPKKAFKKIKEGNYDCIVSDYQMPELNGLELLKKVREDLNSDIPFIIFTGKGRKEVAIDALNLGADRYLQKQGSLKPQFRLLAKVIKQEAMYLKTKKELSERERYLSQILQGDPVPTYVLDKEHRVIFWNKALENLTKITAEEIVGTKNQWKAFYREKRPTMADLVLEKADKKRIKKFYNGKRYKKELENTHRAVDYFPNLGENGKWLYFAATPIEDEEKNIIGAIETLQDITKQKQKELELKKREKQLETVLGNAKDAIIMIDTEDRVHFWNKAAEKMFGYNKNKVKGRGLHSLIAPKKYKKDYKKGLEKFKKTGEGKIIDETVELEAKKRNGSIFPVELTVSSIKINEEHYAIAVVRDITKRKKKEERQNLLHSLLSHDIKNKNQVIKGYLELLKEKELSQDVLEILEKTIKALLESEDIIEKIKTLKQIEEEETSKINPKEVIKEIIEEKSIEAEKKGFNFEAKCPEDVSDVMGGKLLKNIFNNLINNSIKHSKGSKIKISCKEKGEEVIYSIEDDGKGVPNEIKEKLFERGFNYGETAQTGLGLYLVKQITEHYNGKIEVKNSDIGGTKFNVHLKKA